MLPGAERKAAAEPAANVTPPPPKKPNKGPEQEGALPVRGRIVDVEQEGGWAPGNTMNGSSHFYTPLSHFPSRLV